MTVRVPFRGSMGKASEHAPDHNSWLVYDALAACVCASCPQFEQGAAGLSVLIMVLFCGYLIPADNIPDWWIWVSVFPLLLLMVLKRKEPSSSLRLPAAPRSSRRTSSRLACTKLTLPTFCPPSHITID